MNIKTIYSFKDKILFLLSYFKNEKTKAQSI